MKCLKCGEPLGKPDDKYCVFCKKSVTSEGQEDLNAWKAREGREDW